MGHYAAEMGLESYDPNSESAKEARRLDSERASRIAGLVKRSIRKEENMAIMEMAIMENEAKNALPPTAEAFNSLSETLSSIKEEIVSLYISLSPVLTPGPSIEESSKLTEASNAPRPQRAPVVERIMDLNGKAEEHLVMIRAIRRRIEV